MVLSPPKEELRQRVMNSAVISEENGFSTLTFLAMGTRCRVVLVEPTRQIANDFLQQLLDQVADFEAAYSRFLEGSLISRINAAAGLDWCEIDPETQEIFRLCDEAHFLTGGSFDPTALPLIKLWNWKAPNPVPPNPESVEAAKRKVGWKKVLRKADAIKLPEPGMSIDLGGIGKEYAVDRAIQLGRRHGIENLLVDFGQDIRVAGKPPGRPAWHLGLEDPLKPGSCWGSVALRDGAVATSGAYFRNFRHDGRTYGHILDPRTGYPAETDCLAATAIAPTCVMAGILTTAGCILGSVEGYHLIHRAYGCSGAFITARQKNFTPRFYEHLVPS